MYVHCTVYIHYQAWKVKNTIHTKSIRVQLRNNKRNRGCDPWKPNTLENLI